MATFNGFAEGEISETPIPEPFFSDLLPQIDHLGELKLTLYFFWRFSHMEGSFHFLRKVDFESDQALTEDLVKSGSDLDEVLRRMVTRGTLLEAAISMENHEEIYYFLNSSKGRAAILAIENGSWRQPNDQQSPIEILEEPPNIFRLYEQNIGSLTPMIADALGEAEDSYSTEWIQDAFRIAVENNKRSWRYVEAILKRWEREGRDVRKGKEYSGDSEETRRRYVEGEFSDFVEH